MKKIIMKIFFQKKIKQFVIIFLKMIYLKKKYLNALVDIIVDYVEKIFSEYIKIKKIIILIVTVINFLQAII